MADPSSSSLSPSMSGMHAQAKITELIQSGSYDDALDLCQDGARSHPEEAMAFVLLAGHASLGKQAYDVAIKAYEKVLGSVEGDARGGGAGAGGQSALEAWNGILQVRRLQGDVTGLVEALENLLKLTPEESPGDVMLRIELAERYAELGEYEKSQALFWHVLSAMPIGSEERLDSLCKMADSMLKQKQTHVDSQVEEKVSRGGGSGAGAGNNPAAGKPPSKDLDNVISSPSPTRESISCIKLDVMAAQAARDDEAHNVGVSLNNVLTEIMETSPASLKYLRYREEYLRRCLLRIFHHPPRSTERQQYRLAALRECVKILCTGGQCSSFAFEAAVWLLEEEEEVSGCQQDGSGSNNTVAFAVENFARRMYHQFPCNPTAKTLLVMMMRRRHYSRSQADRLVLETMLEGAIREADGGNGARGEGEGEDGHRGEAHSHTIDCASGFRALAELHYENRHYAKAHNVSLRGLEWLQERRDRGHESLSQVGLGLRLVLAKSLRRLGKLEEAEEQFQALAGWVSEGEIGFGELCGSLPTSIHQQSLRGIALVAVERGDTDAAMSQYERILGKASLGRAKAEHWAHADYGWLLYQRGDGGGGGGGGGDLEQARVHLEKAIEVAEEDGGNATDSQIAEHRYRLGEVYWKLSATTRGGGGGGGGGDGKDEEVAKLRQLAYAQFYESAKVESHFQAAAVAALGRHYEAEGNAATAQRCFKKALSIDPGLDLAGELLCRHLLRQGKTDVELIQFLGHLSRTQTAAVWTHREIAAAEMRLEHWETAVGHLLKAVKLREKDAMSWENLGICFFNMGRLDSANKAIGRALAIDPTRTYGNIVMDWIDMVRKSGGSAGGSAGGTIGDTNPASGGPGGRREAKRDHRPSHDLELLSEAYRHFKDSMRHMYKGAVATSLESLTACGQCAAQCGRNVIAAEKLLGDVAFLRFKLGGGMTTDACVGPVAARRHYATAIHLAPNRACLYRNLCATPPDLVSADVAARCLEASLRLDGGGGGGSGGSGGTRDEPEELDVDTLSEAWSAVGTRGGRNSRYALIRALMLDRKNFAAWQALEALPNVSEDERAYCRTHVKQLHKEEKDVFARVLASKMDPGSSSDLFSRMQVAELFGPELMSAYLSDPSNPMRSTVAELVSLLSCSETTCRVGEDEDEEVDEREEVMREYTDDRKRRHEFPWRESA